MRARVMCVYSPLLPPSLFPCASFNFNIKQKEHLIPHKVNVVHFYIFYDITIFNMCLELLSNFNRNFNFHSYFVIWSIVAW